MHTHTTKSQEPPSSISSSAYIQNRPTFLHLDRFSRQRPRDPITRLTRANMARFPTASSHHSRSGMAHPRQRRLKAEQQTRQTYAVLVSTASLVLPMGDK
ncbi:hypothetical protein ASPSYDRAFT_44226 [Aspergillus sydowii CBS 593.65]|uniref:Uncharacterized protein n=1 Tax=Aspergillus sydowii CBS 593.65 TaxID=1036612 RepID=A0A1L9TKB3_9EURO|nr:uncharacterized protein ASPSYDRAFT_44226 [Aspergillus sydowii CBS 593.65]OJJ59842.1 hypothetical protein ASPSYDRAFT_44226 [Aspergillus sydowii CBS 593.65]